MSSAITRLIAAPGKLQIVFNQEIIMRKLSLAAAMAMSFALAPAAFAPKAFAAAAEPRVEFDLMTWPEVKHCMRRSCAKAGRACSRSRP